LDSQGKQGEDPGNDLCWLAAQRVQMAPFSPVHPGMHWQSVLAVLPAAENEPCEQGKQAECP